jgi:hypothetical protein
MTKHILTPAGLIIGMGLVLATATAQQRTGNAPTAAPAAAPAAPAAAAAPKPATPTAAKPAAPAYKQPKTSWGEPDISGMWPINHLVSSRLQRAANFGDRLYLTDEEFKAKQASAEAQSKQRASGTLPSAETGAVAIRQTSLIVDPPNGQFPALTDYGKQLQAKMNSTYKPGKDAEMSYDGISDFGPWDRCITRGLPVSMLPRNYNNGIRITQSPGFVIITVEMAHEARIIPTTPMPKLDPEIKQWLGESRGHWEGNTLVIETTNFNGQTELTSAGVPGSPGPLQPSSINMKTIERITRTGPDSGEYSMQIIDPTVLATGSFTIAYPMMLDNSYKVFEYACHEGNTAVRQYIEAARYAKANPRPPAPAGAAPAGGRGGGGRGGGGGAAPAAPPAAAPAGR